ncbi:MAG: prepilin-type N-terminal cleavage/methylation domain-containing protein [Deltaproteobacteria bacterium]|jgi:type IV pilus modification protein PilV|nr:prepilin-type N-terminal cleavage/methylation domain-containing protein [Deltaproteobacteria bacterium]
MISSSTYGKTQSRSSALKPGFTLLEVIVTVLIISIGCMAALMMQSSALKSNSISDNMTVGTFLAESEIERLKAMAHDDLKAEISSKGTTVTKYLNRKSEVCPSSSAAGCQDYIYTMELNYFLPQPTNYSVQAEIEVRWTDNTGKRSIFYSTIFTDLDY